MKYYFTLQSKIAARYVEEWGLSPWMAITATMVLLLLLYSAALQYPHYAQYALPYLQLSVLLANCKARRISFLRFLFDRNNFIKARLIELTALGTPLILICVASTLWWTGLLLIGMIPIFALWKGTESSGTPIPTPFSKSPFEFIILIRTYWPIYLFFYMLIGIGIYVSNLNLSIVTLSLTALIGTNAYEVTEPRSLLRNYTMPIHQFLKHKIQRGIYQAWITVLLPSVAIGIAFPHAILYILIVWGYIVLAIPSLILMKYSIYPRKILILEGLIFAILMLIPFLLLAALPYYYQTARKNLKSHGL